MKKKCIMKTATVSSVLILLWLFRLDGLTYLSGLFNYMYWLILLGGMAFGAVTYWKKSVHINSIDFLICLYCVLLLLSTVCHGMPVGECVQEIFFILAVTVCANLGMRSGKSMFLRVAFRLSLVLTVLNTMTALIFTDAMFKDATGASTVLLLGPDNSSIRLYLLAIMFACIYCRLDKKGISYIYAAILNLGIFSFTRDIASGKVCFVLLIAGLLLKKVPTIKKMNGRHALIINAVLLVLLVILQKLSGVLAIILPWLNRNATLSHRTTLWSYTVDKILQKPVFGYGHYGIEEFNQLLYYELTGLHNTGNPHNTYLTVLFSGGVILFAVFCLILWKSCRQCNAKEYNLRNYLCILSFFVFLVHAQAEGRDIMYLIMMAKMVNIVNTSDHKRKCLQTMR